MQPGLWSSLHPFLSWLKLIKNGQVVHWQSHSPPLHAPLVFGTWKCVKWPAHRLVSTWEVVYKAVQWCNFRHCWWPWVACFLQHGMANSSGELSGTSLSLLMCWKLLWSIPGTVHISSAFQGGWALGVVQESHTKPWGSGKRFLLVLSKWHMR